MNVEFFISDIVSPLYIAPPKFFEILDLKVESDISDIVPKLHIAPPAILASFESNVEPEIFVIVPSSLYIAPPVIEVATLDLNSVFEIFDIVPPLL